MLLLLLPLFLSSALSVQVLWKTTSYSAFALGCGGGAVTPLYFDAAPDASCVPTACFCTSGTGSSCRTVSCVNVTAGQTPTPPSASMIGFTGYSDSTCNTPTQFKAALQGCSTYGGGSVSASCSATQLFFTLFPTTISCAGGGGNELSCNIATTTCGTSPNGACGTYARNTCGSTTTTTTTRTTTTPAMTTTQPASASRLSLGFAVLLLLLLVFLN